MSLSGWCGQRGRPNCLGCRVADCTHGCHTAAMALVDGCPECVRNVEAPRSAVPVENGWRCGYSCVDCGHAWTTDWAAESLVAQGNLVVTQPSFGDDSCENRDAPAGCLTTAARADHQSELAERGCG